MTRSRVELGTAQKGVVDDVGVPKGLGLDHVYCVSLGCVLGRLQAPGSTANLEESRTKQGRGLRTLTLI